MKMKTTLMILAIVAMNFSSAFAGSGSEVERNEWSRTYKVADLLLVRPMGLVMTVAGAGLFVATLPVTIISGDVDEAGEVLVKKPAKVAFSRR